jgi:hypothetical protein
MQYNISFLANYSHTDGGWGKSVILNHVPPSSVSLKSMSSKHLLKFLLTPPENFARVKGN